MRVWLSCFLVMFAIAELYQWMKQLTLPLPIYILGGAFLAIASNYNKFTNWSWGDSVAQPPIVPSGDAHNISQSIPPAQPTRSISFTIRQPEQRDEKDTRGVQR